MAPEANALGISATVRGLIARAAAARSNRIRCVYCFGVSPNARRKTRCRWNADQPERFARCASDIFRPLDARSSLNACSRSVGRMTSNGSAVCDKRL